MNLVATLPPVFERDLRAKIRTPWPYIEAIGDPLLLLLFFGPLVAGLGTLPGMPEGDTLQWFVPGILVFMVFTTAGFAGVGLQEERQAGSLERLLVTPASRTGLLLGRVLRIIAIVEIQAIVMILVTIPFGLSIPLGGIALAMLLLGLLAGALALASFAVGLFLKNAAAFWGLLTLVFTPVIVTSGVLLPITLAPDWLYAVSRLNPLSYAVDAQRALFASDVTNSAVPLGFTVIIGFALVSLAFGVRGMRRIRI
ncbi:ABC transporter permease [Hoyosella sp. YIM 151337]|uniref:ABC transporter permease n=1 Tax=Hoyosella sp. YIM 151337 TaxID=2992742 RepID=UPI0022354CDD|nr:ABC transporter permease [Hoyosella sp. YIM 151337]MCW4355617.1 ABC transporter permease [Hoyosella sp. YIM 151337]